MSLADLLASFAFHLFIESVSAISLQHILLTISWIAILVLSDVHIAKYIPLFAKSICLNLNVNEASKPCPARDISLLGQGVNWYSGTLWIEDSAIAVGSRSPIHQLVK